MNWQVRLSLFLILLLGVRTYFFFQTKPHYKQGQEITLKTTLFSEPQVKEKTQSFYVDDILIITSRFPEYHYGQTLELSGIIQERVLNNKKQVLTLYFPNIKKDDTNNGLALIFFIRQKIMAVFKNTLPNTEASLILGIIFGFKENLPRELLDGLRISGTLHVVAASGMNVSMVGSFLSSVFGVLFRRQIALVFSILGILFYALLAGFEPSIIRASVMGILSFSALILGRQNLAILSLALAGYLMILFSPEIVLNVGFQLSFMATLGLIIIKPKFGKLNFFGDDLTTTLSAQLATFPILLSAFGNYSPFSIFSNALVLWTIPPIMILGGLASIFSLFLEPLTKLLLLFCLPLVLFFEQIILFFSSFGTGIVIEKLPLTIFVGYYLLLASLIFKCREK